MSAISTDWLKVRRGERERFDLARTRGWIDVGAGGCSDPNKRATTCFRCIAPLKTGEGVPANLFCRGGYRFRKVFICDTCAFRLPSKRSSLRVRPEAAEGLVDEHGRIETE